LILVSPYARKHYVNHNVADCTAILRLIETRFKVPALTKRDAAQINMTQFFSFNSALDDASHTAASEPQRLQLFESIALSSHCFAI
jgi:phospholipase C